ncbi:MAG: hypothetical protein ACRYG8_02475 [Janthinobacterium lividum]
MADLVIHNGKLVFLAGTGQSSSETTSERSGHDLLTAPMNEVDTIQLPTP